MACPTSAHHLLDLIKKDDFDVFARHFTRDSVLNFEQIRSLIPSKNGSILHLCSEYNAHLLCQFICSHLQPEYDWINSRDFEGKTPLHVCCIFGSKECAKVLLVNGANCDALKRGDWIPLMNAITKCDIDLVRILLEFGADPTLCNKDGWNSLHLASRTGDWFILSLLAQHSKAVKLDSANVRTNNGRTLLHIAAMNSHVKMVENFIADNIAMSHLPDVCGVTPFMDGARVNCVQVCELTWKRFSSQLNINDVDNCGRTALHHAAQSGAIDTCIYLVDILKADINLNDKWKQSPLFLAVREGHEQITRLLIERGAKFSLDSKDRSLMDIAKQYHGHTNNNIFKYLNEQSTVHSNKSLS